MNYELLETEVLFRPSEVYNIMTNPKEKSPTQQFNEAEDTLGSLVVKYHETKNKETATALKLKERIAKLRVDLPELKKEADKNEPHLSAGTKKFLRKMMIEIRYKRYKEFDNKYVTKGRDCEEQAITIYSLIKGQIFENNKGRIRNEFFTGEIDLGWNKKGKTVAITDIKNSYSVHTFYDNEDDIKKQNRCQGLGYLDLYPDAEKYHIANMLVDNTEDAVLLDLHRESYKWQDGDTPNWRELQIIKEHIYTRDKFVQFAELRGCVPIDEKSQKVFDSFVEIPMLNRMIEHTFERDEEELNQVRNRIEECRLYLFQNYNIKHVADEKRV